MLKFLHVASFKGNIGDNANHLGFYDRLRESIGEFEVHEFEIRRTFWKDAAFDNDFAFLANQYDAVIFGGGNFFELWVDHSSTGCSIDIPESVFKKINVPMIFNSLGVDPAQGASTQALAKFKKFIDLCIARPDVILSCRNDGSYSTLVDYLGTDYAEYFYHIHDAGFHFKPPKFIHPELHPEKNNIIFQLAGDMPEVRFHHDRSEISFESYIERLARVVNEVALENHIIFCPHIYKDLSLISAVLELVDDYVRRNCISVASCLQGKEGAEYIFSLYSQTDLNVATRFHGSVCSLGMGQKTIGLVNYRQIRELYSELSLQDYAVDVTRENFDVSLTSKIYNTLQNDKFPGLCLDATDANYSKYLNAVVDLVSQSKC